ncbi:MAG: T9SS type A sorting domain-containing protein [Bacteroidota bacterium]
MDAFNSCCHNRQSRAWCNSGYVNFSVATISPQPQYIWTAPNGMITAGQTSNNIDVTWGTGAGNVTVRAYNTCGASSTRTQSFTTPCREEAAAFNVQSSKFNVYPNPAHDKIKVSFDTKENSVFNIKLTDISGRMLLSENHEGNEGINTYELDLSHFSKGVYVLEVNSGVEEKNMKVVIE